MGNIFSCIRPKNARLKKAQPKRRTHKKSKMQKNFENIEVKTCLDVEDSYLVTAAERKGFGEEKWQVEEVEEKEEVKEKNVKEGAGRKQWEKQQEDDEDEFEDEDVIQDYDINQSEDRETEPEPGDDFPQELITNEDYDVYQAEDQESEPDPVKKIYHYKAENWKQFHAALEQEYREQYEDDPTPSLEQNRTEVKEYVEEMLDAVLDGVEDVIGYRNMMSETEEGDWWTPAPLEGKLYNGSGILKKNVKDEAAKKQREDQQEEQENEDDEMIQDYGIYQSEDRETVPEPGNDFPQEVTYNEDYDIYQAEDQEPEPEPVKKMYHYKAENWKHFHAALEQEYREQYEDDLTPSLEQNRTEVNEYVEEMLDVVLDRVEDVIGYRKLMSETEEDRWTPPPIEGEVYSGSGILKKNVNTTKNHERNITWAPDVKPPASDMKFLDPIVEAFMRERSRLVIQRTKEERRRIRMKRQMARLHRLSCRQVNNSSSGLITEGCRIPVPIKRTDASVGTPSRLERTWNTPSRIPVPVMKTSTEVTDPAELIINENRKRTHATMSAKATVKQIKTDAKREINKGPDRGIIWPNRIEQLCTVSTKAYYIEQFQRTELFRQRYRKRLHESVSWEKGLTPFQIWVVRHTGTVEIDKILHPTPKPRPKTAKARVSCKRSPSSFSR